MFNAATTICQAPLYIISMLNHAKFNVAFKFKLASSMCDIGNGGAIRARQVVLQPIKEHDSTLE